MTPLLLLPGMMCDARLFAPQLAAFSAERAVQVAPLVRQDSMDGLAAEVLAHAPPRFALAGLSMGGIVAMAIVSQAPERVAGLALLDTNPLAEAPEVRARRPAQIARARAGDLAGVMREEMKPNYLADAAGRPDVLLLCTDMALALGAEVFARQSAALAARPDRRATLRRVTVPTLILMGREDRLCPRDRHELMHELVVGSRLVIVDGAGHLPTLEQPAAVIDAMGRWLEAVDRAR
jgi:pimeloyl-ACP methyl ester carboxylesterase